MNMLRQLPQGSLGTCILRITPASGRIFGVYLLRQYAATASKSQKRKDDTLIPQEPKKPLSAYNLFFSDFYHEKHQSNPSFKVTEIARLAGEQWTKLPVEEKKIYQERQKETLSSYKKSHKEWLESLTSQQIAQENTRRKRESKPGKKKRLRLIKDPNLPKKPKTSYINYIIEHMNSESSDAGGKERIKELAYDWKNVLTPEDKKPYEEAYQKDKLRYEKEMKTYKGLFTNVDSKSKSRVREKNV